MTWIANTKWEKVGKTPTNDSPQRKGDIAEHEAIIWLWSQGYDVFKNSSNQGAVDLIALNTKTHEVFLIDVKSYKDGRLSSRTDLQKELGVRYLHYNPMTKKIKFINHRTINKGDT